MKDENKKIARLIKQIQKGNQSAFEEFYKLTSPKAYFLALKITQNEHDAEDILQESYMKALEKVHEIDTSRNVTSWLLTIVSNKSKDLLKSKNRLVFEDESETVFEEFPEEKNEFCPEENLNQEELRLEVMAAIDELTDEKRACIMMMYFGDMSVKEIAESIEVPESTVKNRLYTARRDLRTRFEKNGNILYGAALGGVLIWALNKTSLTASAVFVASAASAEILAGTAAGTTAAGVSTTAATAAATTTAASTAASTGGAVAAKVAAFSIAQKVAIGVAATAIVGGSTAGVVTVVKNATEEMTTAYFEEVTTSVVTAEDVFNELTLPIIEPSETTEATSGEFTSAVRTSKPESTTAQTTTQRVTATQRQTTTRNETTTQRATTTRPTTTVPATRPTTTQPTTQAKATVSIDIIDLDGSVIDSISIEVDAGTTLSREYIVTAVRENGYEPMAGVYGSDVGTVAQSGQTYHFEAEL